jgi:hypothetical protein
LLFTELPIVMVWASGLRLGKRRLQRLAVRSGQPALLRPRRRSGLPIDRAIHDLAHALKPLAGAAAAELTASD